MSSSNKHSSSSNNCTSPNPPNNHLDSSSPPSDKDSINLLNNLFNNLGNSDEYLNASEVVKATSGVGQIKKVDGTSGVDLLDFSFQQNNNSNDKNNYNNSNNNNKNYNNNSNSNMENGNMKNMVIDKNNNGNNNNINTNNPYNKSNNNHNNINPYKPEDCDFDIPALNSDNSSSDHNSVNFVLKSPNSFDSPPSVDLNETNFLANSFNNSSTHPIDTIRVLPSDVKKVWKSLDPGWWVRVGTWLFGG